MPRLNPDAIKVDASMKVNLVLPLTPTTLHFLLAHQPRRAL